MNRNQKKDCFQRLQSVPSIIEKTFPIPGRFRSKLPSDIAQLSELFTNRRGDRSLSYLGRPNFLSAYLHYFLPWNLYRLCLLLQDLDIQLPSGSVITDLGSGTLTFPAALWIARPDLRDVPLEFFCVDRSGPALEAGKKFFNALTKDCVWKINLIKKEISHKGIKEQKGSTLVCAINLYNEIYENIPHSDKHGLKQAANNAARLMHALAAQDGCILTVEPGIPQSGKFISFLREAFMELGSSPLAPCTHSGECPLPGSLRAKKWCHFTHEDFPAPEELVRLSNAAKLPKEKLVYSYLLTGKTKQASQKVRIISGSFPLPGGLQGRYGCGRQGLVLISGDKHNIEKINSGCVIDIGNFSKNGRDAKSGALIYCRNA